MIEIPLIYCRLKDGTEYLDEVCSSKEEAIAKLEYLMNRIIKVPTIEDEVWNHFGLDFQQSEHIASILSELKSKEEENKPVYFIKYDYLEESNDDLNIGTHKIRVVSISAFKGNSGYVHTVNILPDNDAEKKEYAGKIFKISLPEKSAIGQESSINMNDFIIKRRSPGSLYKTKKGVNNIRREEYWLFIKRAGE
jgi:hypothetical protein